MMLIIHLARLEHLHENRRDVGTGGNESLGFPRMCEPACVLCYFYFIHTNADGLKGSIKQQLLKSAFHICHHLPAGPGSRHTACRKGTHVSLCWAGRFRLLQRRGLDPVRWVFRDRVAGLMSCVVP